MDHAKRFYRAMGAPDGLTTDPAKSLHTGRSMVKPSTYVEDNEDLAHRTAAICVDYVRDAYINGELDALLLGDETPKQVTTKIVAALNDGYLRKRLSDSGRIVQPTKGVADLVVASCLARLAKFVEEHPVDPE